MVLENLFVSNGLVTFYSQIALDQDVQLVSLPPNAAIILQTWVLMVMG